MKKTILLLLSITLVQLAFAQKQNYLSDFISEGQIRKYLSDNIAILDPVEGIYDVQASMRTGSPFVRDYTETGIFYFVKNPSTNIFDVYQKTSVKFGKSKRIKIEPIGETSAYRLYWNNSSNRAYLENKVRLRTRIELSQRDAGLFMNNPDFDCWVVLSYDMVKKYPTGSMFADAFRKQEEEPKATEWTGTGFAISDKYIVTNYHVVENANNISVHGINGIFTSRYSATLVAIDKINDLALLSVNGVTINFDKIPYSVKTVTADVGEDVFVMGYPLTATMGDEVKLTTGVVSSKSGFQGDISMYQISAPVQPGNSGGPHLDSKGNVIGIISAKHRDAENVSYAIKASYLNNLIESFSSTKVIPQNNKLSGMNLSEKVKAIKDFVYYIKCESIK